MKMTDNSSRLITISCANHHEKLVKGLWTLVTSQHNGLDFNLQWGVHTARAHRLIVEVFLTPDHLSAGLADARQHPSATTQQPDKASAVLDYLLEFLYTGAVAVPEPQLDMLLEAAKHTNFKMLVEAVQESLDRGDMPQGRTLRQRKNVPKGKRASQNETRTDEDSNSQDERQPPVKRKTKSGARKSIKMESVAVAKHLRTGDDGSTDSDCVDEKTISQSESHKPVVDGKTKGKGKMKTSAGGPVGGGRGKVTVKSRAKRKQLRGENTSFPYECQHCSFKTQRKILYDVHLAEHDPNIELFPCGQCSQKFPSRNSLGRHESRHSGVPYTHECPHCPSKFLSKWAYEIHQSKHDPSIQVFRCDLCSHAFLNFPSLERHQLGHATYTCTRCDYVTRKRWQYDDHLFSAHGVNAKGEAMLRLECSQCSYTCKTKQQINNHVIAHHSNTKPFKCSQCSFASGRKTDLVSHINVNHKGIKKELCETCGYRTVSKSKLEQHKLMHSGLKPYFCVTCEARYSDRSSLKRHINKHVNPHDKPYVCHMCDHRCNRRSNLKVHLKNVHRCLQMEPPSTTAADTTVEVDDGDGEPVSVTS